MPQLENPKHERFCIERARGASGIDAYERAGFKRSAAGAVKLGGKEFIQDRIKEVRLEIEEGRRKVDVKESIHVDVPVDPALDKSIAEQLGITEAYLMAHLKHNIIQAQDSGQYAAANKAIELLLKLIGTGTSLTEAAKTADQTEQGKANLEAVLALSEKLGIPKAKADVMRENNEKRAAEFEEAEEGAD